MRNLNRTCHTIGSSPVLSVDIELIFEKFLIKLSDIGVGLNKFEIMSVVRNYLIKTEQTYKIISNYCLLI